MENGRRYCGDYFMPNDEAEQDRMLLVDEVHKAAFDYELTTVPLVDPKHILDVGTGIGEWALDMADMYPECEVTAFDISAIFPRKMSPNCFFEIDDAELEWERPFDHDLVHLRHMAGAFRDWPFIYSQVYKSLKPGGYIEVLDFDDHNTFKNILSFFPRESLAHRVSRDAYEAAVESGRPRGVAHLEPRLLTDAGFEDIQAQELALPFLASDSDMGPLWLKAAIEGLEPTILRLLTKYKGWTAEEVREATSLIGDEMKAIAQDRRRRKDFQTKIRILTGRKPDDADASLPRMRSRFPTPPDLEVDSEVESRPGSLRISTANGHHKEESFDDPMAEVSDRTPLASQTNVPTRGLESQLAMDIDKPTDND
jgi:SAM-dependent methyltransferase